MRAMSTPKRRTVLLAILAIAGGLACFALGVAAARLAAPASPSTPAATTEPRIMIDAGAVQLLPDASLQLTLPPGFDAGLE